MEDFIMINKSAIEVGSRVYIKPNVEMIGTVIATGIGASAIAEVQFDDQVNITHCFLSQLTIAQKELVKT